MKPDKPEQNHKKAIVDWFMPLLRVLFSPKKVLSSQVKKASYKRCLSYYFISFIFYILTDFLRVEDTPDVLGEIPFIIQYIVLLIVFLAIPFLIVSLLIKILGGKVVFKKLFYLFCLIDAGFSIVLFPLVFISSIYWLYTVLILSGPR